MNRHRDVRRHATEERPYNRAIMASKTDLKHEKYRSVILF